MVYLGKDPEIGRVVAIKTMTLSEEFEGDALDDAPERFFREAETAGRLQHQNIGTIFMPAKRMTWPTSLKTGTCCRFPGCCRLSRASPKPWLMRTSSTWCTGTSSLPTSCMTLKLIASRYANLALPELPIRVKPRPDWRSVRRVLCPRNSSQGKRSMVAPTFIHWASCCF